MDHLAFPADQSVKNLFGDEPPLESYGPIALITEQMEPAFAERVNHQLCLRRHAMLKEQPDLEFVPGYVRNEYRKRCDLSRFSSGEGKAVLLDSVRGHDLFILTDVLNCGATYRRYGTEVSIAPDEHFQDLARIVLSARDSATRINVIMPYLYEGRRYHRKGRESLDCAMMLRQLFQLGIDNFITFDARDARVANAVPRYNFESFPTSYQTIRTLLDKIQDLVIDRDHMMIVSPDESSISRCIFYASSMKLPLGIFYLRHDFKLIDGKTVRSSTRTYLGDSPEGKDILIVSDLLDSGNEFIACANALKARGAKRVICAASFAQFTEGIAPMRQAWENGVVERVFTTDMTYRSPELLSSPWYTSIPMADDLALLIMALNHDASLSRLLAPAERIAALVKRHTTRVGARKSLDHRQISFSDLQS